MPRPRRAAAEKAKGHYSETTRSETRKKRGATADPVEAAEAGPSKRPRGSKKSEDTKMKGTEDEKEEDPNLPLGLSTRSFTHEELMDDLNVCYIDLIPPASFDLPKRQKRWTQPESKPPIESIEKAPEGWNMDEPDLDPTDLDAQIERCKERIEDRILPAHFRYKLEDLMKDKEERNSMMLEEPGLSWPVVERLDELKGILEWLRKDDEFEMFPNVEAIINAYRSESLKWIPFLITYWHNGSQISQLRPFRLKEHDHLSNHFGRGFWVEGLHEPRQSKQMAHNLVFKTNAYLSSTDANYIPICVRIPGHVHPYQMEFRDDTGADFMQIGRRDLDRMADVNLTPGTIPNPACTMRLKLADGKYTYNHVLYMEVNIFDNDDKSWVCPEFDKIQVVIQPDLGGRPSRLAGPWLRHRLFTSTIPNGYSHELYASDDASYYQALPLKHNPDFKVPLRIFPDLYPANMIPFPP